MFEKKESQTNEITDSLLGKFIIMETSAEGKCFYDSASKSKVLPTNNEKEYREFIFKAALENVDLF